MEAYKKPDAEPPLPPLTARHVFDWLMEVGPVEAGGMGPAPLSWREIAAWAEQTFQRPSAWETRTLRRLSREYLSEIHAAEDQHRVAPWSARPTVVDRAEEERRLRAVLG